ncbi:dihydroneopterin aldolase [Gloeothece verrucosa]|uniref:7,8-dihydroneopterin aldolase n=1 Tax=Gloeothece verrucosa (strain PCC 7822) TaxID=497965 RepID=E0U6R3_GLOV7|nr:dihydroneopterin aldolase [Gloeothece verrucosa]ADN14822.1 dihydroneopterin aldolase [Gloeothece verrucosa PCC 7822]
MDAIKITEIKCYGYTGYLPEEQILGQWFEVSLTLWLDLTEAGSSDDIEKTLDYRQAISIVKNLIKNSKFALIEKLATVIADELLQLPRVQQVRVELSKPAAPIPDFGGNITIDITRPFSHEK